ncbi:MAG: hypothetical protein ACRD29_01035 [Acidimicrobiales bacterium]
MRRAVWAACFTLLIAIAGCGGDNDNNDEVSAGNGGDGDLEEFCDQIEALDEADEEGTFDDLSEEETADAAIDILENLAEAAPDDDIGDDLETMRDFIDDVAGVSNEEFEELDEDEQDELEEQLEDFEDATTNLQDFAEEECDVELDLDGSGGEDVDTDDDEDETTTTEEDQDEDSGDTGSGELPDAGPAPVVDDPTIQDLIDGCESGDMQACDDLFFDSDVGSPEEEYGRSCGGRVPEDEPVGVCVDAFPSG